LQVIVLTVYLFVLAKLGF